MAAPAKTVAGIIDPGVMASISRSVEESGFRELFPQAPVGTRIVAHFGWSGYDEGGNHYIVEIEGALHEIGYTSSVESNEGPEWRPRPITEDAALDLMAGWDAEARELEEAWAGTDCSSGFSMP